MSKKKDDVIQLKKELLSQSNESPAVYTHKQMSKMMGITRSWTLNSPSGALPFLPVQWCDWVSDEDNLKAIDETLPPSKKTHLILRVLMKLKLI